MIINVDPTTRVGVAYRSPIKYHVTGTANTASGNPALDAALNKAVFADIKLPDTFTVSGYKRLDDKWEVMADLAWTGWAKIQDLNFRFADTGAMLSATHEGWRNTWRGAIGASYQFDTAWKLRAGLAYDQTMVPDQFRTPRLPDNDRTWVSVGAQYRINAPTTAARRSNKPWSACCKATTRTRSTFSVSSIPQASDRRTHRAARAREGPCRF